MPIIQVTLTRGRNPEAIRAMISRITTAVEEAGVAPRQNVRVVVHEIPGEHFAAGDVTLAERRAAQADSATESKGQS